MRNVIPRDTLGRHWLQSGHTFPKFAGTNPDSSLLPLRSPPAPLVGMRSRCRVCLQFRCSPKFSTTESNSWLDAGLCRSSQIYTNYDVYTPYTWADDHDYTNLTHQFTPVTRLHTDLNQTYSLRNSAKSATTLRIFDLQACSCASTFAKMASPLWVRVLDHRMLAATQATILALSHMDLVLRAPASLFPRKD